jgi:hypothetical protein
MMSRLYDAKHEALKAHPNDEEAAIDLFVGYVGMDMSDIEYELGESVRDYIFGKPQESA